MKDVTFIDNTDKDGVTSHIEPNEIIRYIDCPMCGVIRKSEGQANPCGTCDHPGFVLRPKVLIESPYAGDVHRNMEYLRRATLDSLRRGENPYASHKMLTDALNDMDATEREEGIGAGLEWHSVIEKVVVYVDYGMSGGMVRGIATAKKRNLPVEERTIGRNPKVVTAAVCLCLWAVEVPVPYIWSTDLGCKIHGGAK